METAATNTNRFENIKHHLGSAFGELLGAALDALPPRARGLYWRGMRAMFMRAPGGGWAAVFCPADLFDGKA